MALADWAAKARSRNTGWRAAVCDHVLRDELEYTMGRRDRSELVTGQANAFEKEGVCSDLAKSS